MDHLLFSCSLARLIWQVIVCAFGAIRPPNNIAGMFGDWLGSFPGCQCKLIQCGGAAVVWTIWKTRNAACFKQKFLADPAAVIYTLCNNLDSWEIRQK